MSAAPAERSVRAAQRLRRERAADLGPRGLELRDLLDEFAHANADDPIAIAAIPAVVTWARWRRNFLAPVPEPLTRRDMRAFVEHRKALAREDPAQPSELFLAGEILFQADGPNQHRPVEPIMRRLGGITRPSVSFSPRRVGSAAGKGVRTATRLVRLARKRGVWMPKGGLETIYPMFILSAQMLAYAESLLDAVSPRAVVSLAMVNLGPRALVHSARRAGIPSVYFSHSAVLMDPTFNDLPVDFAGLRGSREVEYYTALIGESDRIEAIGDPSLHMDEMPGRESSLPPVLAPPLDEEDLVPVIELVREGVGEPVLVSPHPHADRDLLKSLLPDDWEIWGGRTYDLLRKGPPMLIGFTSGVMLEALRLGIPTIELRVPADATIGYPFIREPYVRIVTDAQELAAAASECRAEAERPAARQRLRDWALEWSFPVGEEAAEMGVALVERAAAGAPPGPIWSAWPDPGARAR